MTEHHTRLVQAPSDDDGMRAAHSFTVVFDNDDPAAERQLDNYRIPLTTREPCAIHSKHIPETHLNERHHVWPLGEGGPNIEDNLITLCATGHNNVHELLKLYKLHRAAPPYSELRRFSRGERQLAALGWERIFHGSM